MVLNVGKRYGGNSKIKGTDSPLKRVMRSIFAIKMAIIIPIIYILQSTGP